MPKVTVWQSASPSTMEKSESQSSICNEKALHLGILNLSKPHKFINKLAGRFKPSGVSSFTDDTDEPELVLSFMFFEFGLTLAIYN